MPSVRAVNKVVISDTDGDELAIPLEAGQTWASAELPANLARLEALAIAVR